MSDGEQQQPQDELGGRLATTYRTIGLLGKGGMGSVYEVEHRKLKKRYALKVLHDELAENDSGAVARFGAEAQVMANFSHPGIVAVQDYDDSEGVCWLRMELVEGIDGKNGDRYRTLRDRLRAESTLPEGEVVALLARTLEALSYVHQKGRIHRDLKPENILLDEGGPKISDFGLVGVVGGDWLRDKAEEKKRQSLSFGDTQVLDGESAALVGTIDYMSPEQRSGATDIDARSDLYAVGLLAYEMLTGSSRLGMQSITEVNPGVDPAWDRWIKRATSHDPESRFQSAAEMLEALHEGTGIRAGVEVILRVVPDPEHWTLDGHSTKPDEHGLLSVTGVGSHELVVGGSGWADQVVAFEVSRGQRVVDLGRIDLERGKANLLISTSPVGSTFELRSLDDEGGGPWEGHTPKNVTDLPTGRYAVRLTGEGLPLHEEEVILERDRETKVFKHDWTPAAVRFTGASEVVSLSVTPVGAPDDAPSWSGAPADVPQLWAGNYTLCAKIHDQHFGECEVELPVKLAADREMEIPLELPHGTVALQSDPPGAKVYTADGDRCLGVTPWEAEVPAGDHRVLLVAEGHDRIEVALGVRAGQNLEKVADLQASSGALLIHTEPEGATVMHGKKTLGTTPCEETFAPGSYPLTFELDGYKKMRATIEVPAGSREEIVVELVPKACSMRIEANVSPFAVRIDGELVKRKATSGEAIPLTPGEHTIRILKDGWLPVDLDFEIHGGQRLKRTVTMIADAPARSSATPPPLPKELTNAQHNELVALLKKNDFAGAVALYRNATGQAANLAKREVRKIRNHHGLHPSKQGTGPAGGAQNEKAADEKAKRSSFSKFIEFVLTIYWLAVVFGWPFLPDLYERIEYLSPTTWVLLIGIAQGVAALLACFLPMSAKEREGQCAPDIAMVLPLAALSAGAAVLCHELNWEYTEWYHGALFFAAPWFAAMICNTGKFGVTLLYGATGYCIYVVQQFLVRWM